MTVKNKSSTLKKLIRMMELHLKTLEVSSCDKGVLDAYMAVIDFIDLEGDNIIVSDQNSTPKSEEIERYAHEARTMSLDSIEKIVSVEDIPRKNLETIAIYRFGVPKGSLRKLGAKEDLREKVLVMVRNQRVHQTIGEVGKMSQIKK